MTTRRFLRHSWSVICLAMLMILLAGCQPPPTATPPAVLSPNAITIETDGQPVAFEFQQDGQSVAAVGGPQNRKVVLRAAPFTLVVPEHKRRVSIAALRSADLAAPLQTTRPLVALGGGGNRLYANDIYVYDRPLDVFAGNTAGLAGSPYKDHAGPAAEFLQAQLGTEPLVLGSVRTYMDLQSDSAANFSLDRLMGSAMTSGQTVTLLVFVEKDLGTDSGGLPWIKLQWATFNIEFQ